MSSDATDADDTSVILADDHAVVRKGLWMLIDAAPGLRVVAEAGTVPDAVMKTRALRPGVLVLDLNMPGGSSLDAIPAIRAESPDTAIVVLTMQEEPAFAKEALSAGAIGYVLKRAADDELVEAVRRASRDETYLNPTLGALIALGHTNVEIGEQLFLSVRTVETHRAHIHQKLRVSSRAELVRYALKRGLVTEDDGG